MMGFGNEKRGCGKKKMEIGSPLFLRKLMNSVFIILLGILPLGGCRNMYKAGNLKFLGYPIETSLNLNIVSRYLDTLKANYGYALPEKWIDEKKLDDLDSLNNIRIYFKSGPEEMYLITISGQLLLGDIYNEQIRKSGWVAIKDSMPVSEEIRVKNRLKKEILLKIELLAKRDSVPDSLLYWR